MPRLARAALGAVRRRAGVLLQLGRRGDRGRAQVRAQGDGQARGRRARGLASTAARSARSRVTGPAGEAGGVRAARARASRSRGRTTSSRSRRPSAPDDRADPARAGARRGRRHPARRAGSSQAAAELADEHGALLVLDEVQTGRRPHGHVLRLRAARRAPDLVTLAKGLAQRAADRRAARRRRGGRRFAPGRPRLDVRRQPGRVRGGVRRRRRDRRRRCSRTCGARGAQLAAGSARSRASVEVRGRGLLVGAELDRPAAPSSTACLERGLLVLRPAGEVSAADAAARRRARGDRRGARRSSRRSLHERQDRRQERRSSGSSATARSRRRRSWSRDALRADGFDAVQTTVSRDIPSSASSRCVPRSWRRSRTPRPPPARPRLPRAAPGAHGRVGQQCAWSRRSRRAARPRARHALDDAGHPRPGHVAGENTVIVRRARGRLGRRPARRAPASTSWKEPREPTAVLAYSGGLDTSCAIAWLEGGLRLRRGRRRPGGRRPAGRHRAGDRARPRRRRERTSSSPTVATSIRAAQVAQALKANALYPGSRPLRRRVARSRGR